MQASSWSLPHCLCLSVCLVLFYYGVLLAIHYTTHAPCSITTVIQALNYSFPVVFFKYFYSGYQPGGWTTQTNRLTAPQQSSRKNTDGILSIITGKEATELCTLDKSDPGESVKAVNWQWRIFWYPGWASSCKEGPELVLHVLVLDRALNFGVCIPNDVWLMILGTYI